MEVVCYDHVLQFFFFFHISAILFDSVISGLSSCDEICYKDPVLKDQQWSAYIDRSPGSASYSQVFFLQILILVSYPEGLVWIQNSKGRVYVFYVKYIMVDVILKP